jgi:hypothetical protein
LKYLKNLLRISMRSATAVGVSQERRLPVGDLDQRRLTVGHLDVAIEEPYEITELGLVEYHSYVIHPLREFGDRVDDLAAGRGRP